MVVRCDSRTIPSTKSRRLTRRHGMQCPRCNSSRVQRDYDDAMIVIRLAGLHKLLCNNCGMVFKGFDPLRRLSRALPEQKKNVPPPKASVIRSPRYHAHLPATISLIKETAQPGLASYSEFSRGHCDTISKTGMGLTFVGAKIPELELTRKGRLLFVRVDLPEARIEAVTAIINPRKTGDESKRKWHLGVRIQQISDDDAELLKEYLERRARSGPVILSD
jgi:hypothetical protein